MYAATIRENVVMDVCEHSKEETYQVERHCTAPDSQWMIIN